MSGHHFCPVCGFPDLHEPPVGQDGSGSYEICPSCGFEFGVSDDDLGFTFEEWRRRWIALGMPWDSADIRQAPAGWNPVSQLAAIGHRDG